LAGNLFYYCAMRQINRYLSNKIQASKIVATDENIRRILHDEIKRLGSNADLNHIDVSKVTNMDNLFANAIYMADFNDYSTEFYGDVSEWNVSNAKTMAHMFERNKKFNCDLSNWDVHQVEDMTNMFYKCENFEGIGLDKWHVYKVKDIQCMFFECEKFSADLSNWQFDKLLSARSAFCKCFSFNSDLNDWNMSNCRNMQHMLRYCINFNKPLDKWKFSQMPVPSFEFILNGAKNFCQDLSMWQIPVNKVSSQKIIDKLLKQMFDGTQMIPKYMPSIVKI